MNLRHHTPHHSRRLWIVGIILGLCVTALIFRLIDLGIINRSFLLAQCAERTIRDVVIPSYRGIITDRNGEPLAISTPVYAAWVNPKTVTMDKTQLAHLSVLLEMPVQKIQFLIQKNSHKEFVYLRRDLPPETAKQIKQLDITGLAFEKQYRRFYPEGESTAQILGFTNIDDIGQEGIELAYNQWLQGSPGLKKILKDRYGNAVADLGTIREPIPGKNLTLSIDSRLQYIAYNALLDGVNKFGASSGSIVILNIHTGEILAMANVPTYNPNARPAEVNGDYRNRAVTDLFEPGSTVKAIAMTTALSTGRFTPNSTVNTSPGYWYVEGKKIDDDGYNNGVIDMTKILEVSSNVGMSKVMLSLPSHRLFIDMLNNLGFGQTTGIHFPGESPGYINKAALHSSFVYATLSFGYSISVNLLQLAHTYATLANNGIKIPLSLLKLDEAPKSGIQVVRPEISLEIRTMLESVLHRGGTAVHIQVPGYRVTGKTGTTRLLGPHGYDKTRHNGMFVGIAPASSPELVVAVMMHDPRKKAYFGGDINAPVFSTVMSQSLRILNIPPDDLKTAN
jgi:cell division protein FtsI (penicillin-binding protein 3)